MNTRIGIFGGTFNPIHNGHLALANCAKETLSLDKLLFIPSGISYMKENVLDVTDRLCMVKAAIEGIPGFELSTIEADRPGNSYSYETILSLKSIYKDTDLYFIVGADSFLYMEYWRKPDVIFENAIICVANRNNSSIEILEKKKQEYINRFHANIEFLPFSKMDVSSSKIRELAYQHKSLEGMVPKCVSDYILQNNLYFRE